ncbi:MAG: hypothetical protein F4W90_00350 [Gammaproteobacteria bacterium]|nr:hypothetical protein [Gammaproteobacteria bacterium]
MRDIDGDSIAFTFHLTISEDLQPSFAAGATIESASYITDSTIEPFTLPTAMGGNGALTYDLSPNLPNGISIDTRTFEIAGTPLEPLAMSRFDWSVTDADGDSVALHFYLTVDQDEQPLFTAQVADRLFIAETPIRPIQLPNATSGNGELSYTLTPSPGNGLSFDASTATIAGTPLDEAPNQSFTWTVTDIDGDSTSLMFDILVQPASPETTGSLANARLFVGGSTQTIDANTVFRGRIDTWSIEIADSNVASLAIDAPGVLTLTPRFEGQTTVSIAVANVTGSAATSFMVSVDTAGAELSHIDSTLSLNASAALGSVMNVFKKRSRTRATEPHGSSTSLSLDSVQDWELSTWHQRPNSTIELDQYSITRFDQSRSIAGQPNVSSIPLNFSHTATSWSIWGAMDLQSLSSHDDEIDGSMNSLFLGADYTLGANTFAGLALARHAGSSTYQFTSVDANGEGSLDTNLTGFYPYLQHGDGNRYSLYIVGGKASGDIDLDRSHAHGTDQSADGELSVFGAGLDVVLWRRSALDISLVGDAGTASLSSSADSGILNDREGESSRFSFGASFAFNQTMDTGQMALAADLRGVNEGGDESSSGLEMGVNLNFIGEHMDFMLDARRVAGSSDMERIRNSASARLRYQARVNGSGLTASISNRWQDHWFEPNYSARHLREQTLLSPFSSSVGHSLETKLGYGFWTNRETALFEPRIKWIDAAQGNREFHVGAVWRARPTIQGSSSLSVDLIRPLGQLQNAAPGMALRLALPL